MHTGNSVKDIVVFPNCFNHAISYIIFYELLKAEALSLTPGANIFKKSLESEKNIHRLTTYKQCAKPNLTTIIVYITQQ